VHEFYPDFDIVVIDSDSDNFDMFKNIPNYVTVHFAKNKNFELGAWYYAFGIYDKYDIYMFLQDTTTPRIPIKLEHNKIIDYDYFYSFHWYERLNDVQIRDQEKSQYFLNLKNVYKDTGLQMLSDLDGTEVISAAGHNCFIANSKITAKILELENPYIDKKFGKTKVDSWLSERTIGIIASMYSRRIINLGDYFTKKHLARDYIPESLIYHTWLN